MFILPIPLPKKRFIQISFPDDVTCEEYDRAIRFMQANKDVVIIEKDETEKETEQDEDDS